MGSMKTPRTRAEFERNFHLLKQKMKDGKLHFSKDIRYLYDGLLRVRFLPNGRIDFLSIDEFARLHANMMNQFDDDSLENKSKENQGKVDMASDTEKSENLPVD